MAQFHSQRRGRAVPTPHTGTTMLVCRSVVVTHTLSPYCSLCQALTTVASTLATFFLARRGGAQSVWRAAPRRVRMALAAMALGVVAQVCVIVL